MSNPRLFDVGSHALNKLSSVLAKYERDIHRYEREVERLKMENERLRGVIHRYEREVERLKMENKRLRDVIEGMRVCADDDADANDCPFYDKDAPCRCKMGQTLKELGIDEG